MTRDQLLELITNHYLDSQDFNGAALGLRGADSGTIRRSVEALIRDGMVAAVFGDGHPNPHIRALPERHDPEKQVELLNDEQFRPCFYPLPKHLEKVVDPRRYEGKPYTLALARGEPQLVHRAFELAVLETYRNDPRYAYNSDDIHGSLYIRDDSDIAEPHQIVLRFGFAYDDPWRVLRPSAERTTITRSARRWPFGLRR